MNPRAICVPMVSRVWGLPEPKGQDTETSFLCWGGDGGVGNLGLRPRAPWSPAPALPGDFCFSWRARKATHMPRSHMPNAVCTALREVLSSSRHPFPQARKLRHRDVNLPKASHFVRG